MGDLSLSYKIANSTDEFEQIYQLNYETFVDEIPQHSKNSQQRLVDRFDQENTYVIAKDGEDVVGMIAIRGNRPFSLDGKIADLDYYLPQHAKPCEIRLLAVKKEYRNSFVFFKLCDLLVSHCLNNEYNMALISGVERQIKLYKRIGFVAFGEMTGSGEAKFQPMYLTREQFEKSSKVFQRLMERKAAAAHGGTFLPGPVSMAPDVLHAISQPPISHRSQQFKNEMLEVKHELCRLVQAKYAEVIVGTGTLANDIVAAQIQKLPGKGLILVNGEFGCRLVDHASRFNLDFSIFEKPWNTDINMQEVDVYLQDHPEIQWLWTVHCETSTGYLYDLTRLQEVCKKHEIELCIDACSSVGVVPVQLSNVYLAATVSGKGLGSYPGLAIVFHREPVLPDSSIPRYLDLGMYHCSESIPFTHSSNLINALSEGLKQADTSKVKQLADFVRTQLIDAEFAMLGNGDYSPGIITLKVPDGLSSRSIGDQLKEKGIFLSYESDYLIKRNWVQISLMGFHNIQTCKQMIQSLLKVKGLSKVRSAPL